MCMRARVCVCVCFSKKDNICEWKDRKCESVSVSAHVCAPPLPPSMDGGADFFPRAGPRRLSPATPTALITVAQVHMLVAEATLWPGRHGDPAQNVAGVADAAEKTHSRYRVGRHHDWAGTRHGKAHTHTHTHTCTCTCPHTHTHFYFFYGVLSRYTLEPFINTKMSYLYLCSYSNRALRHPWLPWQQLLQAHLQSVVTRGPHITTLKSTDEGICIIIPHHFCHCFCNKTITLLKWFLKCF